MNINNPADPLPLTEALVLQVRILNSERETTLLILAGELRWMRSETARLEVDMRESPCNVEQNAETTIRIGYHAQRAGVLLSRLGAQNTAMRRLRGLTPESSWPCNIVTEEPAEPEAAPKESAP